MEIRACGGDVNMSEANRPSKDVLQRLRDSRHDVVCPCLDLRDAAAVEIERLRRDLALEERLAAERGAVQDRMRAALERALAYIRLDSETPPMLPKWEAALRGEAAPRDETCEHEWRTPHGLNTQPNRAPSRQCIKCGVSDETTADPCDHDYVWKRYAERYECEKCGAVSEDGADHTLEHEGKP